jgi:hypothetical protein
MKKLLVLATLVALFALAVKPAVAAKKEEDEGLNEFDGENINIENLLGAKKYLWHLSGSVMPEPPYGSMDIPGSDTASKLVVHQKNKKEIIKLKGVMKGLHPNTTYTVYLSNGYTPYQDTGWDLTGNYVFDFEWNGAGYPNDVVLTQTGSNITGSIYYPNQSSPTVTGTVVGSISGNAVTLTVDYDDRPYNRTMTGTIDSTGNITGNWSDDNSPTYDNGSWATTSGNAVKTHTGDTGWPGLLTGVSPFTFKTNCKGKAIWHYKLNMPVTALSVWINEAGATMLISDSITF